VKIEVRSHTLFPEVFNVIFEDGSNRLATLNLVPGKNVYGERLIKIDEKEYRLWDPFRSKLASAILKGIKNIPIKKGYRLLYLGAASGTTASHISDIVGEKGYVFCIEFSSRSIRDLIDNVCRYRKNMAPILSDARFPKSYLPLVGEVDVIYCDVAQPDQADILVRNSKVFLKKDGSIIFLIKARSIDVTKKPSQIYKQEISIIKKSSFVIKEIINLDPYEKDHVMVTASYHV
jgi:fibrillarin-like pre-rRNA processing protein